MKETIEQVQKLAVDIKSELDKKGVRDAETQAKLDKMTDSLTKQAEDVQKAQMKAEAAEKAADSLRAALERVGQKGDVKTDELVEKSKKELNKFFREKNSAREIEVRAMSTENDPMGGYLVLPEMATFMVTRAFETSPLRQVARVVSTSTNEMMVTIDDDEAAASWEGQGINSSETDTADIGRLSIVTHKVAARPRVTQEMLDDPIIDIEAWLREKIADKFSRSENTAFVGTTGTGIDRPKGILAYSNWAAAGTYERNKLEWIALGHASTLTSDGLISLQSSLKEAYQSRATFLMKRATYGAALQLKGADNYYFGPTLMKDGQMQLTLLGKPVVFCDDMQAVGANNLAVAYGDFSVGYTIVDRIGLNILRDPFTNKGVVEFYATKRVGGAVTNFDAIKIGKVDTDVYS